MTEKQITNLIHEILEKTNFVANISIVLPQAEIKTLLNILPNYARLFDDRMMSWRVTNVKDEGIMLEIDKTNYPHWERKRIINTTQCNNVLLKVDDVKEW